MKIFNGATNPACRAEFAVVIQDKQYFAFLLISGTGATLEALATRADTLTVGREWRVVAYDRGCGVMSPQEWTQLMAGHPNAVAVMLDAAAHPGGIRRPVDWLSADALEYRIEEAFSKAEAGGGG